MSLRLGKLRRLEIAVVNRNVNPTAADPRQVCESYTGQWHAVRMGRPLRIELHILTGMLGASGSGHAGVIFSGPRSRCSSRMRQRNFEGQ